MKIMLLCSAFNGLSQRVWAELRAAGHPVRIQLAGEAEAMCTAVTDHQPDLIIGLQSADTPAFTPGRKPLSP